MKKIVVIMLILPLTIFGQNADSLKLALKSAKHDTTRCNLLKLLATFSPNEEQIGYTNELEILVNKNLALNPAQIFKYNYTKHLAFVMRKNGIFYYGQGDFTKGLDYFLKGLKLSEEVGDKKQIGRTLGNIAVGYHTLGDHKKALEYFYQGLKLGEEVGYLFLLQ